MKFTGKRPDWALGLFVSIVLIAANLAYVSYFTGFIHSPSVVLETDHYRYLEMARGPEFLARSRLAQEPPFCWRLLVPFLAYLATRAGLGPDPAFFLLAGVFLFGYLMVFFAYLKQVGLGSGYALLGIVLVALTPGAVRWYGYQYWMTDPAGLFFVVLAFYLIERGNYSGLLGVSTVAVTARETFLAVPVYYFFYLWKRRGLKTAFDLGWPVILIPLLLLSLIRYYVVPVSGYDAIGIARDVLAFRWGYLWPNQLYLLTLGSFGVVFPLLLLFPGRIFSRAGANIDKLVFVLVIYLSLAAGYNTDRLLVYALPVLLVPALENLIRLVRVLGWPSAGLAVPVIVLQVFFYLSTRFYGLPAVSIFLPASIPVVALMSLAWIWSQVMIYRRRAQEVPE